MNFQISIVSELLGTWFAGIVFDGFYFIFILLFASISWACIWYYSICTFWLVLKSNVPWHASMLVVLILSFWGEYPESFLDLSDFIIISDHYFSGFTEYPHHLGEVLQILGGHILVFCDHEVAQEHAFQAVPLSDQHLICPARTITVDLNDPVIWQNVLPHIVWWVVPQISEMENWFPHIKL